MTEAINRYHTAKGYFQSSIMIHRSPEQTGIERRMLTVLSMMMLTGFSLELYFKAWMLQHGKSSVEVIGYRHDIRRVYADCQQAELAIHGLDELVNCVADGHQDFTYRYIREGAVVQVPGWEGAFEVLNRLDNAVDEAVGASASQGLEPGH